MTGMMVLPMISLMLVMMKHMYPNQKLNRILHVFSVVAFIALFAFERQQAFIGDTQFVKSMIPHHSGAVLMCEKADIKDEEIKTLCAEIVKGQTQEIEQMKNILARLKMASE